MAYTHFDALSTKNGGYAVGKKGSEVVVIDSSRNATFANVSGQDVFITAATPALAAASGTFVVTAVPYACTITKIYTVINGAITTGDATLTFKIGTVAITSGAVVITQVGSAQGDVDSATPTAANVCVAGDYIACAITGGGGTATGMVTIVATKS